MSELIVRIGGNPTPEHIQDMHDTLRGLVTKLWLVSEGRIDDLQEYVRTGDVRFEQEAVEAGNSVELVKDE